MPKDILKVPVRTATIRVVGAWYAQEIAAKPHLAAAIGADTHKFLTGLARRSTKLLVMERAFAEEFVLRWRIAFKWTGRPDLLLAPSRNALAALVADIHAALKRPEGTPPKADPLEALAEAQAAKARRRNYPAGATVPYTIDMVAELLNVSRNTAEKAIKQGKVVARRVRTMIGEADPLAVLTKDGTTGLAIVQGEKRHLVVGVKKKT